MLLYTVRTRFQYIIILLAAAIFTGAPVSAQQGTKPKPAPTRSLEDLQSDIVDQYSSGEWAKVVELANAIQKLKPRDTTVNTRKAIAYAMLGNKEMAARTFITFYRSPEDAATILSALPTKLSDEVADRDAIWYTNEAIRIAPRSTYGYMLKAAYLVDDSAYAEALVNVRKAWELSSDSVRLLMVGVMPGIEQRAGGGVEAYQKIEAIRQANPRNNEVAKAYFLMLNYDKRYDDALAVVSDVLQWAGDDEEPYWHKERGYLYKDMGKAAEACEEARWLINRDGDSYEDMFELLDCPEAFASLARAGVKEYVYGVDFNGEEYDFIVTPEQAASGLAFGYRMTNASETAGRIAMTDQALDTARDQMNMFSGGKSDLDRSTTVWVSRKVFSEIKENGETQMNAAGELKTFRLVDAEDQEAASEFSGSVGTINYLRENGMKKKTRVLHLASEDGAEHIWINDDASNPLIVGMNLGWKIGLREVFLR